MTRIPFPFLLALTGAIVIGCSNKTPEQIEADKYPKVKQMTPEEDKAFRQKMGVGMPLGAKGAPPNAPK